MNGRLLKGGDKRLTQRTGSRLWGKAVAAALGCGLLLRLWFVLRYAHIMGDALVYGDIAKNLLQHHVYGFTATLNGLPGPPRPTLIRLPGYPLFLALCFQISGMEDYRAVLGVQVLADLWTCLLLGGVAARLFGRRAGVAAVWLAALCPFTANYTAAPLTETLTLFCIAAACYALLRWVEQGRRMNGWVAVLGCALAYAVLLRPEQGLLAAAIIPAMTWLAVCCGWNRRGLGSVAVAALLTVLPLAPWALRNWRTFHVVQPLAPRFANDPGESIPYGFQRWYRTWAIEFASTDDVYWNYDGSPIAVEDLPARAFDSGAQYESTATLLEDYNQNTAATPALDARFNALAATRIAAGRLRYFVALPVARVLNMALRPRVEMLPVPLAWWRYGEHWRASAFATVYAALNFAYFALAAVGLWQWRARGWQRPIMWALLGTVLLRTALLLTLDNSEPRYTLEFFPVLIVLGSSLWRAGLRQA